MTDHTPGPWQWNQHEDDKDAGSDNPGYLYAPTVPYSVANEQHPGEYLGVSVLHCAYPSHGDKYVRITAKPEDARLLAAAPDLLAALDQIEKATSRHGISDANEACNVAAAFARAAIAKARGEAVASS